VSRAHFAKEGLAEHICSIVDKYNVPHHFIELELTESAFFDDKEILIDTVKKLRESGFIVSMDDFGAGYSSLNSLKELQLDVLKLDADFFRGVESVERGMLIVSEIIDLAKN
jgi:EAL domain-containing protein (putative c-di-GMP-specific phosphodiesterase class I)